MTTKKQKPEVDEKTQREILKTATFVADMIQQAKPSVQVAGLAVAFSSLLIVSTKPDLRMKRFDDLVKDMRHHVAQANLKDKKATK